MRIRREKPSTDEERKRASELRRIIGNARTAKAEREAAQLELDVLAPPKADARTPAQLERRAHYLRLRLSEADGLSPSRRSRMENELVELTGSLSGVRGEKEKGISDRSPVSPQSKPAETEKNFVQNQKEHLAALVPGTFEHDAAIAWCSIPAAPEVREAAVKRY